MKTPMSKNLKCYYNNIECTIITELPNDECVIELTIGYSETYYNEYGDADGYVEPIETRMIVPTKSITKSTITKESALIEADSIISKAKLEANVIINEAKSAANEVLRNEKLLLQNEISKVKKEIAILEKASPYIQTAKKFIEGKYLYGVRHLSIMTIEECKDDFKKHCIGEDDLVYEDLYLKISENCISLTDYNPYSLFETLDAAIECLTTIIKCYVKINNYSIQAANQIEKYNMIFEGSDKYRNECIKRHNDDITRRIKGHREAVETLSNSIIKENK